MWELVSKLAHGRISVRRISLLAIATMMTFFVASFALTAPAHADDVERDGNRITYQGNTYSDASKDNIPPEILAQAPNTQGYYYIDDAAHKAHFILTSGDPTQATTGYYVVYDFTPPANFSNSSPPVDVKIVDVTDDQQEEGQAAEQVSACDGATLGGIGWIVCPTVNFIARSMDKIYQIISEFLVVKTVTADTNSPLYQLWKIVRDIANVAFVIALLIIIYSQLTSVGISNYGIKNTLPRIIIAAILVNISYWVCTVAVDASNILGYAIHSMFMGIMEKFSVGANYSGTIPTWEQVAAITLAGTAAVAGTLFVLANTVSGTLFLLIPFLLSAVMAALVALIVLATRQALITIFIIISPLAFVAYVLPNTEKWFTKWREAFMTLLLLFPIFSVIFSGAQLAGMAIVQSAGGNLFTIILGMAVQVAPIVVTPMLVKFSGSIIGKVAGIVNNPNKGLLDRTRNWSQGMAGERKAKVLAGQSRYFRNNPLNRATKALDTRRRRIEGRRKAYDAMADNRFAATRQGHDIEAMNRSAANEKQRVDNHFANSERGRQLELQSRNLGVQKQEIENSLLRTQGGHELSYRQKMAEVDKTRVHNEFEQTTLGDKAEHAERVVEMEKKIIESTHQAEWDEHVRKDAGLLELDLNVKRSEVRAAVAKDKLEKMHAEIVAQGDKSEHILNLRGVDMHAQAGMLNIAHDIKQGTIESAMTQTAKTMAERELTDIKKEILKDDNATMTIDGKTVNVREYAAGIKLKVGERSLLAKAKSESSAATIEDAKNIQSTLDHTVATDPKELRRLFNNTDVFAEKVAYAKAMAAAGTPGMKAFRTLLADIGDASDPKGLVSPDNIQDFKEFLASEQSIRSAGKDIETYLYNKRHGVDGDGPLMTFKELSNDVATWKNMSPAAFASQSEPTQEFALTHLYINDRPAYERVTTNLRNTPMALANVKQRLIEKFSLYSDNSSHPDPGKFNGTQKELDDHINATR